MAEKNPTASRSHAMKQPAYNGGDNQANTPLDLGAGDDAPPAYGTLFDQLHLSQAGFNAGAVVTDDGRVNINIKQTSRQLSDLLAPALRGQFLPSQKVPLEPLPPAYIPPSLGGLPGQTPPPKLNVVIQIVGSRGDVQPFVALGKVLKDTYGHRVRIATHAVFQNFVEENGLEFFAIGGDPAELMAFMVKNPGLMPGTDALKSGEITKRRKGIEQIVLGCWRSCMEAGDGLGPPPEPNQSDEVLRDNNISLAGDPNKRPFVADAIIANPPSFAHIHIAEKMGIPLHMMFTMPWSPTKSFPHPLANIESSNAEGMMTNYISYALVEMMTWQGLGDVINRFRTKVLDLEPLSLIWAPGLLSRLHIPTTYCWSPALIPKPNDWGREINIPGFYFLDLATSYTPDPDLAAFLEAGPPPVYIGFGSIVVDDPNKLTRMIFDAITISGVRALVSKGWGGLGADSVGIPEGVFMLGNCPHDWLFKKVSCVVHHGGAGTTAAGIKTGTPTVVVPFFGDQPFWGAMIAKAGAGPAPTPYKKLTAEILAESITTALKPETQARAKELGESIRQEKGTDLGAKNFHDFLDYDKMRCSIAPSRTAVWRVRRTQVKLSALAASSLVKENVIKYSDLKLYRSQEHDTEEQPWDPISAVTAALVGDVGSMAMAIGDIPRDWYKKAKKAPKPPSSPGEEPSIASTSHETGSSTTLTSDTAVTSGTLSPSVTAGSATSKIQNTAGSRPSASPSPGHKSSQSNFDVEAALGAGLETGKNVSRVVETGVKTPMNFCMSLAKGFRNAPRLYNDDTVRKQEKVTGLASGVMLAGKEFGLGLYDGITGLATQPYKGAQKEGVSGLIKGFAKGLGGIVLKPQAGFWAIPAYTMKGLHAEVRAKFHRSVENYIIVSRILQGEADMREATVQEKNDIIRRFKSDKDALDGLAALQAKEKERVAAVTSSNQALSSATPDEVEDLGPIPDSPPKTGFWQTKGLSLDERKKRHALKDAWKKKHAAEATGTAAGPSSTSHLSQVSTNVEPEDEELERAIRESVAQTSHGDPAEDAQIERQIRASVVEMRRIAAENRGREQGRGANNWKQSPSERPQPSSSGKGASMPEEVGVSEDITDEEFEALVAEAARRSLMTQQPGDIGEEQHGVTVSMDNQALQQALQGSRDSHVDDEQHGVTVTMDDEALRKALEESRRIAASAGTGENEALDDDLRRAMEESAKAHQEHLARQGTERSEEEIIMEYVKQQSLAEEEFRRKGKGTAAAQSASKDDDDDDDEDLRRAMEESLRLSGQGGGPSRSS
ncbi:hypothetical protein N0V93_003273 [Gnomoniopsis smithogilvyi]|uniref:Glycosyltransferase family 28 N-terminal domain-containing protein n=1 Tax=Gnomoniopsis smithogilvyi TaxID=1191159 RepID=A0A9W8YY48_9PEZI|nr:hypothetical protein N0V93_003273 [Gnomoniopsis smithogilvyi]